jgi:K+/H+ antiporter YhaU regulatory subunit KhtT
MLQDNVGENEVVSGLTKELNIKENEMKERDDEISGLIEEKKEIEDAKNALAKQIEEMKSKSL